MPARNLISCLELAQGSLIVYLRTHPDAPIPKGSFEAISEGVYFGVISADGSLTYVDVLATVHGYTLKLIQDGYTSIAADILVKGTGRRKGYSVLQWAFAPTDES